MDYEEEKVNIYKKETFDLINKMMLSFNMYVDTNEDYKNDINSICVEHLEFNKDMQLELFKMIFIKYFLDRNVFVENLNILNYYDIKDINEVYFNYVVKKQYDINETIILYVQFLTYCFDFMRIRYIKNSGLIIDYVINLIELIILNNLKYSVKDLRELKEHFKIIRLHSYKVFPLFGEDLDFNNLETAISFNELSKIDAVKKKIKKMKI